MQAGTGDAAADGYLRALVARVAQVLDRRLVGVYVLNSGARGDYLPDRSDLDVAVIVGDALDEPMKWRLIEALRHRALPCPAPRLELVVYRDGVVAAPGSRPAFEVNLNTGRAIVDHVATDPDMEPPHWFVLDLAAASEVALRVVGPPADAVFGSVPRDVVLGALLDSREWHARHDTAAPNRVLNDCRAWRWVATGRWSSKTEAGRWAIEAGGDADVIRHALESRAGLRDDALDVDRVAALADGVGAVIAAAADAER